MGKVIKYQLNRLKGFALVLFLIGIVGAVILGIMNGNNHQELDVSEDFINGCYTTYYFLDTEILNIWLIIIFVFVLIMSVSAFEFVLKRNADDVFHSLPVSRSELYFGTVIALVVINFIATVIPSAWMILYCLHKKIGAVEAFGMYFIANLACIYIIALTGFVCSNAGNKVTSIFGSILLVVLPFAIHLTGINRYVQDVWGDFNFFYDYYELPFGLFDARTDIFYNAVLSIIRTEYLIDGKVISMASVFTTPLTVIFIIAGWICFKKRRSEIAGNNQYTGLLRIILKVLIVGFAAITIGFDIAEIIISKKCEVYDIWSMIGIFAGAIILIMLFDHLLLMGNVKWKKTFKTIGISIGSIIAICVLITILLNFAITRPIDSENTQYIEYKNCEKVTDPDIIDEIGRDYHNHIMSDYVSFSYFVEINNGGKSFYRVTNISPYNSEY